MKKIEKYIKSNKGSITTVVLVTVLFFITILSTAYIVTATLRKSQLKSEVTAKEVYEHDFNNIDTIIEDLRNASYDPASEGVTIPTGFYYVGGTKDTGLVISDNSADENKYKGQTTVGTELQGNQFVWIPVDTIADYKRTAYSTNVATETTDSATNSEQIKYSSSSSSYYFTEAMPEDEKISVETYHGFYIGRYEAGDAESTNLKKMRASEALTTHTITLKKGQAPYNYVTKTQAQVLAEEMDTKQGYSATTKLCSSYAWDTAIAFIQKTIRDYGDSSEEGNYYDTDFLYKDITGASQTKSHNSYILIPTGQTTPVCNIYDMGGNCWELTTELCSNSSYPCTKRGGRYDNCYSDRPAGYRYDGSGNASDYSSFRPTLFM